MKNTKLLLAGFAIAFSSQVHAEVIHCEGIVPYSEPLKMTLDYDSASGSAGPTELANLDGSPVLLSAIGPFEREKQDGYYVYSEVLFSGDSEVNSSAKTLTIVANALSGSGLKAMLSLPQQGFSSVSMTCSIQGKPFPEEPVCLPSGKLNSLLIQASRAGTPNEASNLIACGANVNTQDERGCTPLLIVSDLGCGIRSGESTRPVNSRSAFDIDRFISVLTRAGADVKAQDPVNDQTALHMAAKFSNVDAEETLAELDAGIDAQDVDGNTPLMLAVESGDVISVKTLLSHSPNRSLKNKQGKTAYDVAKEFGVTDMLDLLRPVSKTIILRGGANGGCDQKMIHVMQGEEIEIALQATSSKMFKLDAADLGIDLMAMPGETVKQTVTPSKQGTFPFTCGIHGGPESQQTHGQFMVM